MSEIIILGTDVDGGETYLEWNNYERHEEKSACS